MAKLMRDLVRDAGLTMHDLTRALAQAGYPQERWGDIPEDFWPQFFAWLGLPYEEPALAPEFQCATCQDTGVVQVATPGHILDGKAIPCPRNCAASLALYQRQIDLFFNGAGIPKDFRDKTFESWDALPKDKRIGKGLAYAAARLFVEKPGHAFCLSEAYARLKQSLPEGLDSDPQRISLVLYGDFGVGKSGLAAAIANAMKTVKPTLWIRVRKLVETVQNTYNRDYEGESRQEITERLMRVPLLILDEWTLQINSKDRKELFEQIIRFRHDEGLPFVVTTNHDLPSFEETWGGWVSEAMAESAHWILVGGQNMRPKAQLQLVKSGR